VDNRNDLNVCTSTNEEGVRHQCCGDGTDKSCCEKSASCCGNEEPAAGDDDKTSMSKFQDVDMNEWAGMCYFNNDVLDCELLTF
jgi:hypothetical protein